MDLSALDLVPVVLLISFLTWGVLFLKFKGYLTKSITSIWETNVDSQTLEKCIEVWKSSRRYTMVFCFLLVFLAIISIIANLGDPTKFGPLVAIILISILYALVWGFLVAGPIKNLLKTRQKQQDSAP